MLHFLEKSTCGPVNTARVMSKNGKRKVQEVPQSQTAALPRHQEEEETDKTKQEQIKQMYEVKPVT